MMEAHHSLVPRPSLAPVFDPVAVCIKGRKAWEISSYAQSCDAIIGIDRQGMMCEAIIGIDRQGMMCEEESL